MSHSIISLQSLVASVLISFAVCMAGNVSAKGIDCSKAKTLVENAICSDNQLLQMDKEMNGLYLKHLAQTEWPQEVVIDQREWVTETSQCTDKNCIRNSYTLRIAQLNQALAPMIEGQLGGKFD